MLELLPLNAADRASSTSETTSEKSKKKPNSPTGRPVVKPRLSPESRGFQSPSTPFELDAKQHELNVLPATGSSPHK
jgi:hypothetical protein